MRTVNASLFWKMYQNVKKSSLLSKGVKDNVKLFIKELNYPKQWVICWKNQQRLQFANKWGGGCSLIIYSEKLSWNLYICHFTLRNSRGSNLIPGNSAKLHDAPWKFQDQKPWPMKIPHESAAVMEKLEKEGKK